MSIFHIVSTMAMLVAPLNSAPHDPPLEVDHGPGIPELTVYEPSGPSSFVSEQRVTCFGKTLVISNVGFVLPIWHRARVTVDGVPVGGPSIEQMVSDLSVRGAEYRFGAGCERRPNGFLLRIYTVERDHGDRIHYRSATARIRGTLLFDYRGLSETEGFWFRR